jgi:AraC-like DNA-binding protein
MAFCALHMAGKRFTCYDQEITTAAAGRKDNLMAKGKCGSFAAAVRKRRFAIFFLSTYILVAALPLVIFGSVLNQHLLGLFKSKIQERDMQMLQQFRAGTDFHFGALENISTLIYMDSDLTAYKLMSGPINAMEGIENLRKYTISYPYIFNVLLYLPFENRVFTASNASSFDEFIEVYKMEGIGRDDLLGLARDTSRMVISPPRKMQPIDSNNIRQVLIAAMPIPLSANLTDRMIFYIIDLATLNKMLQNSGQPVFVFTLEGQLIASGTAATDLAAYEGQIARAIAVNQADQTITLGEERYDMKVLDSPTTDLRYVSLIPERIAFSEINGVRTLFLVITLITTILLVVIIVISKQLHLNPLQALFARSVSIIGKEADLQVGYKTVSSALDYMIDQQVTIKSKYDAARYAIREHLLNQLLGSEIASAAEFNELGQDVGLSLSYGHTCVALLDTGRSEPKMSKQAMVTWIENVVGTHECYALNVPDDRIVLFCCLDEPDEAWMRAFFAQIHETLVQKGITADIAVGNAYPDIGQIPESYREAQATLDYQCTNSNGVLFYRSVIDNNDWIDIEYPSKKIQRLEALLLEGDTDQISSTVDEIIEFMDSRILPLNAARCLSYDIINTLLKTMRVISRKYEDMKEKIPDIMALSGFNSSEALKNETRRICVEICEHIRKSSEDRIDNLAIRIIDYVNKHFCSARFSICTMANDLDLSLSLVSACFKKFMDKTPLEYVTEMRMNMARHLLTTTALSLNDITRQIGYIDTPSFLRKFHKLTGVTPGQYRKLHTDTDNT